MKTARHLLAHHEGVVKEQRERAIAMPSHAALRLRLSGLYNELQSTTTLLHEAYVMLDDTRDARKCLAHLDRAQQRLHRVLKRIVRRENKQRRKQIKELA